MDERLGATYGACVGHVVPEAFVGGPIGLVVDGDPISIDVAARRLDLEVDPEELDRRRQAWKAPEPRYTRGALAKYAAPVGAAVARPSGGTGQYRWLPWPARCCCGSARPRPTRTGRGSSSRPWSADWAQ
jgi:Dehydratase family